LLLGLDIGTSGIKAVVIDASGTERAAASVPTPFTTSGDGVDMTVDDLAGALAAVIAGLGPVAGRVAAAGLTGMAESGAPLRDGSPIAPIVAWHDGRGGETVASLEGRFGPDLARWTGRRVRTVSSVAKLGWLLDHGIATPDRWLGVPEVALWLLTGEEATEHSLAARTGAYDVTERSFMPEVVAHVLGGADATDLFPPVRAAGTPAAGAAAADLFPPVRSAGTAMGLLSGAAASRYRLPAGIPVTIAGHDHLAAATGLGARPGDLLNSVGTAETVVRRIETAPDVARTLELDLAVTVWPGGEAWGVLASVARAGLVLGELAASLGRSPADLDGLADSATEAGRRWTAALTDLAGRTVAAAGRVAQVAGPHDRLVVFGGGSRSRPWLEAKARAARVPVVRSTVTDAAARGAAMAAGSAAGWWPAGDGPVPALEPVDPAPGAARMNPV
jgi:xylulokinase